MKTLHAESGQISGNATFHAESPSLLQRCDNRLMSLCQRLCYWLGRFLLLGLGGGYVVTFFSAIFEYGEGIADMDIVEKGTLLLLIFLLWRHWRYCQYCSTPYRQRLLRPLQYWGWVYVVELATVGIIFVADATLLVGDVSEYHGDAIYERLDCLLLLVALYLAAPRFQSLRSTPTVEQAR
ncbi:hypothetical protein ACK3YJ_01140 [Aeromonas caviae]|uniref:hypothetical protein n=1 Tax=Aeromonas TaxID=642 RepID=UPI0022E1AAC0|nr:MULTISPECIES: hypothetical protein [Aeromonas]